MERESDNYDYEYISKLQKLLKESIQTKQTKKIIEILTSHNNRNIANIGNPDLYRISLIGTKNLINEFRETLTEAIEYVAQTDEIDQK